MYKVSTLRRLLIPALQCWIF